MSLATAVCHTPVSVHWFLCVPVSELWWAPAMPRAAAGTGLPKGRCWCPGPCAWLDIRCAAVLSTWSLFPASSPLCLHSGSVVWHPWGGVIVKQRRKRKRGEAQPAQSLPQNLLAHLRGWVVLGKGTSITSLSYFLGCSSYECIEVLCENFPEYVKFFLKKNWEDTLSHTKSVQLFEAALSSSAGADYLQQRACVTHRGSCGR